MPQQILNELNEKCQDALEHLHQDYAKIQTGRANTALVENVMVDSYGAKVPLKGVATISIPEPKQIAIQPFNRDQLQSIEKALLEADLGLTPQNDGSFIRLNLPPLTEERRRELVKLVHKYAEDSRISIRNARHEALGQLKEMEIGEDELKGKEKNVQEKVDEFNKKVEEAAKKKEQDVMTV
ncbi:ribosome recycling factor [Candidatus Peregrinibacteria bacterium]|nr:ribosome recycling factor [Candidatus Peregrinibacteria bacterium]